MDIVFRKALLVDLAEQPSIKSQNTSRLQIKNFLATILILIFKMLRLVFCSLVFVSCAVISRYDIPDKEVCKTRVFLRNSFDDPFSQLPRIALMPVIIDPNVRADGDWARFLTAMLAQNMLQAGSFPVLEIMDRWEPVIRDEFFSGNHLTLKLARDLGLDILILAYYRPDGKADELYVKVLDARKNITRFYGKAELYSKLPWYKAVLEESDIYKRDLELRDRTQKLVRCAVKAMDGSDL